MKKSLVISVLVVITLVVLVSFKGVLGKEPSNQTIEKVGAKRSESPRVWNDLHLT